jgi:hypothetical protein
MSMEPLTGKYAALFYEDASWEVNGYANKFAARRGIVLHAVNRSWTFEDCRNVFLNSYYPGSKYWTKGDDGRQLSHAQSEKRVRDDYFACAARASEQPTYRHKAEVRQELSILISRVEARAWGGRTGRTDRDVLVGVLKRMSEVGSDRINFSARDAMIAAGVGSPTTASNALKRLVGDQWLVGELADHRTRRRAGQRQPGEHRTRRIPQRCPHSITAHAAEPREPKRPPGLYKWRPDLPDCGCEPAENDLLLPELEIPCTVPGTSSAAKVRRCVTQARRQLLILTGCLLWRSEHRAPGQQGNSCRILRSLG